MTPIRTIAVAIAALLAFAWSAAALAHAELVQSDPAEGATISTPYTLRATFDEPIDPNPERSFISIENPAGTEVARGTVSADDETMMVAQLPELPPGTYTARFQAHTSDDNATERGNFRFSVGAAASPAPTPGGGQGGQANSGDLLIALVISAVALAVVGTFVVLRMRRAV